MRRTFLAVMMMGMAVSLTACQGRARIPLEEGLRTMETDESFEGSLEPENSWVRYMLVSAEDKSVRPYFMLNSEDGSFHCSRDVMSSYLAVGTYEETEGMLKLMTEDGKDCYVFETVDETSYRFVQKDSSDTKQLIGEEISDGAVLSSDISDTLCGRYFRKGDFSWQLELQQDPSQENLLSCDIYEKAGEGFRFPYRASFVYQTGVSQYESRAEHAGGEKLSGTISIAFSEDGTIQIGGMTSPDGTYYPLDSPNRPDNFTEPVYDSTLRGMDEKELRIFRNQFYAVYGQTFESADLQKYFESQPWYETSPSVDGNTNLYEKVFTSLEKRNVEAVRKAETEYDKVAVSAWKSQWEELSEAPYLSLLKDGMETSVGILTEKSAIDHGIFWETYGILQLPVTVTPAELERVEHGEAVSVCVDELSQKMGTLTAGEEENAYVFTVLDEDGKPVETECFGFYAPLYHSYMFWRDSADTLFKRVYEGPLYVRKGARTEWYHYFSFPDGSEEIRFDLERDYWGNAPDFDEKGYLKGLYVYGD